VLILAALTHGWFTGMDIQLGALKVLWIVFLVVILGVFIHHKFIRPGILKQRPYEVIDVVEEADQVWTVKMAPPNGEKVFDYRPGQFQFITFLRDPSLPVEEHHWTISSSPTEQGYVTSTIKNLGDFTSTIGRTRQGDQAVIHAPFGRYSYTFHPEEKDLVFIVGGIGITPVMSMLRHMADTAADINALLLYANPTEESIVFREDLSRIESLGQPRLKVVHVLSQPPEGWAGESGLVDGAMIKRHAGGDLKGKTFYLCGPPGLITASINNLHELGVGDDQIRVEIFSFLD
jgi:ferredoxin-NADP reductase